MYIFPQTTFHVFNLKQAGAFLALYLQPSLHQSGAGLVRTVWFCSAVSHVSCRLTDRELCCQGLNSSCKRPAAPRHAPLLPRWLRDIPAALRRSAHEESVMEWLCEPPGSVSRRTTATLLLLQPRRLNAQIRGRILLPPLPVYQQEGGSTDGGILRESPAWSGA